MKTNRKLKTANEKVRVPHTNQIEVPAAKAQQVRRSKQKSLRQELDVSTMSLALTGRALKQQLHKPVIPSEANVPLTFKGRLFPIYLAYMLSKYQGSPCVQTFQKLSSALGNFMLSGELDHCPCYKLQLKIKFVH